MLTCTAPTGNSLSRHTLFIYIVHSIPNNLPRAPCAADALHGTAGLIPGWEVTRHSYADGARSCILNVKPGREITFQ